MPPLSTPLSPLANVLAGRAAAATPSAATAAPKPALAPALVPQPQRADITHSGGETAQELLQAFTREATAYRNGVVGMAHYGHRLHEMDDWEAIGFSSEQEFYESRGMSQGAWEQVLVLGERLSDLRLEEMRELTAAAAQLLGRIPQKMWAEFSWVEEARFMPARDFAKLVKQRLGDLRDKRGLAEPKGPLSLSVPITLRDQLERRIDSIRHLHRLTSPAATLDFVLRAAEHGPEVITATEKLDQCAGELTRWIEGEDRLEVEREDIQKLLNRMNRCVKELKRYAIGLSTEVQEDLAPGASHAPGR